jgi:predicted ATPase/class 3 adenylate cyclase
MAAATPSETAQRTTPLDQSLLGERSIQSTAPGSDFIDGERKTVTALFADLKGSTALMETLDPEEGRAIVEPLLRIMCGAVRRYEGYLVRTTGDGVFALFGAPIAYEDHPQRALYAALQMQRELHTHEQAQAAKGRPALEARVGVHTGEVVAYAGEASGNIEYRLIGHTANLASRIESIAPPGSIGVSETTAKLCDGYFELRNLGPTTVKGVSTPVSVYEVLGLGPLRTHFELSTRRGLTRFVGRERELEQMRRALEQSMTGHGQLVAVVAEAGTGKSRLFYEFKAAIPAECKVLEAYSVSHGKSSAWLPVLELLHSYFEITETDDAASRRDKVRVSLSRLDPALEDTLPYLFGLLGIVDGPDPHAQMDARIKRQRTFDAIKRIILRDSLRQPVVVIFEDLHWIDEQTHGLLDLLAGSVGSAWIFLLFNYRPEYRHEWANKSYYTQLRLDPFGGAEGSTMLSALLGDDVELNPLKRLIAERSGGNPFFIEEIVRALFEEGALVHNGSIKVTRSLSRLRLPPTVQGMIAARIDRLPALQKELLQTLAVIGRGSSFGLLRQIVSHNSTQLEQTLGELRSAEFIYEQPAAGDTDYIFKHALTQEVGYNSLLIERRKQIHARAGKAIEALFAAHLDDHVAALAYHYRHTDNASKAVEYLGLAGRQSLQRGANEEAIRNLMTAIDLLASFSDESERIQRELPLQLALAPAFISLKGWAAVEVGLAFSRARELCEALGDPPESFSVLFGLYALYLLRGEVRTAFETAEEMRSRAERSGDSTQSLLAHQALGQVLFQMGEFVAARENLENVINLYNREQQGFLAFLVGADVGVVSLSFSAWTLWDLGYPEQALKRSNEALALAHELSHPHTLALAEFFFGLLRLYRRERQAAEEVAGRLLALSAEHGLRAQFALGTILRGGAITGGERNEEAVSVLREGMAATRATGTELGRPFYLCLLAEALSNAGRVDEGLSALVEADRDAERREDRSHQADTHRLKGELLLKENPSNADEAERCFEQATERARGRSAKSLELRATVSLARLLASRGCRDEARTRLAEIYNWFTEGFDTVDLKDAKALLDELSV